LRGGDDVATLSGKADAMIYWAMKCCRSTGCVVKGAERNISLLFRPNTPASRFSLTPLFPPTNNMLVVRYQLNLAGWHVWPTWLPIAGVWFVLVLLTTGKNAIRDVPFRIALFCAGFLCVVHCVARSGTEFMFYRHLLRAWRDAHVNIDEEAAHEAEENQEEEAEEAKEGEFIGDDDVVTRPNEEDAEFTEAASSLAPASLALPPPPSALPPRSSRMARRRMPDRLDITFGCWPWMWWMLVDRRPSGESNVFTLSTYASVFHLHVILSPLFWPLVCDSSTSSSYCLAYTGVVTMLFLGCFAYDSWYAFANLKIATREWQLLSPANRSSLRLWDILEARL